MRQLFFLLCCCLIDQAAAQTAVLQPDPAKKIWTAAASCGTCMFKLKGADCALAVRINGKAYFVDGAHIDSFGNAHATDGFCNAIRKARVQGKVVNNRFHATWFQLLPEKAIRKKKKKYSSSQ